MATNPTMSGPWPEPAVIDSDAVPLAAVRREGVRIDDLREIFDSSFGPVVAAIQAAGRQPVGPAIAVYEGDVMAEFALEVGFPIDRALTDAVEIDGVSVVPAELAAGHLAVLSHVGPYEGLGEAWGRLMGWVREQQLVPGARYGEIYVSEPTPDGDPTQLRSDLFLTL